MTCQRNSRCEAAPARSVGAGSELTPKGQASEPSSDPESAAVPRDGSPRDEAGNNIDEAWRSLRETTPSAAAKEPGAAPASSPKPAAGQPQ